VNSCFVNRIFFTFSFQSSYKWQNHSLWVCLRSVISCTLVVFLFISCSFSWLRCNNHGCSNSRVENLSVRHIVYKTLRIFFVLKSLLQNYSCTQKLNILWVWFGVQNTSLRTEYILRKCYNLQARFAHFVCLYLTLLYLYDSDDLFKQVQVAKGAFKRIKTLRHPNIVCFLDGVEVCRLLYTGS
jgi:hypothetical protein